MGLGAWAHLFCRSLCRFVGTSGCVRVKGYVPTVLAEDCALVGPSSDS